MSASVLADTTASHRKSSIPLKSVGVINWIDRAAPDPIKFCQHFLCRRAASIDNAIERLEESRFIAAKMIDAGATAQPLSLALPALPRYYESMSHDSRTKTLLFTSSPERL